MKEHLPSPRLERPGIRGGGFTLIELLIVISIIAILAGLLIPISGAVTRLRIRSKARAELGLLQMTIENYKTRLGHYPPDNPGQPERNQLYFELLGTTNFGGGYATLDGSARILDSEFTTAFGGGGGGGRTRITGFVNCSRGAGDEGRVAQRFLQEVKPGNIAVLPGQSENIRYLRCSVAWPKPDPNPLHQLSAFRYNSSNPTNNPNSFDLWVDVIIAGKTNRISNWSKDPTIVSMP